MACNGIKFLSTVIKIRQAVVDLKLQNEEMDGRIEEHDHSYMRLYHTYFAHNT